MVRAARERPSFYERPVAQPRCGPPVFRITAIYRHALAGRICGGGIRDSPAARRIRRVGGGAERCAERVLFYAHAARVCRVCAQAGYGTISFSRRPARVRFVVEADARDGPNCPLATRLLAAATNGYFGGF